MTLEPRVRQAMEKVPPHAAEAEIAVLGCILVDCACLVKVLPMLPSGEWFMMPKHGRLYDTMIEAANENGGALDIVLLNQKLEDTGDIKMVGGLEFLVQVASEFPSAAHAVYYARCVRSKHLVHLSIQAAGDFVYWIIERPDQIIQRLNEALAKLCAVQVMLKEYAPISGKPASEAHGVTTNGRTRRADEKAAATEPAS